jgi:hypothetical protein
MGCILNLLERRLFPSQVAPRRFPKHITEVNVQAVPVGIDKNISVMSVFDLEKVSQNRIGDEAAHEILLCRME